MTQVRRNQIDTNFINGWIDANETWTYASASTITVPTGAASRYAKGDKIKLTQTTVKYFYVVGVADTVLTVTGGSDYTVANAAITANYYSHASSPIGFPVVLNFSSTVNGSGGSIGTFAATTFVSYFSITGNMCYFSIYKDVTNKGSWSGNLQLSLPVTSANEFQPINGVVSNTGSTSYLNATGYGPGQFPNSSTTLLFEKGIGNSIVGWADLTAVFRILVNGFCRF